MSQTAASTPPPIESTPAAELPPTVARALALAARLQQRAAQLQTPPERRQQLELDRMLRSPHDKATLLQMTDQAFRTDTPLRAADQFIHILDVQGIPRFFSPLNRTLLKGFRSFGGYAPGVAVPLVRERMRKETANVILPAEPELLLRHLAARHAEGLRMNVNFLGESILGEEEAAHRLQINLQGLQAPEVEVISIKISTLFSQISALAHEHTVATLCERLELLYRTAARLRYTRPDGTSVPKFVYLDMEEYRDLSLTAEAFMRTLDLPALRGTSAGIVLQAYIPDSFRWQRRLNEWARRRVAAGGAPIVLRIVKGANLEAERVEAALRGWPQAPYTSKLETDANFKRMLHEALWPENIAAVHLGIASHNLFDVAYALVLAEERGLRDKVTIEMLEGMANPQRRAIFELTRNLLLYAPVCRRENFLNAIGYLIRRLDENTGPENYLRYAFHIEPGSADWQRLQKGFLDSLAAVETVADAPRRKQNRQTETTLPAGAPEVGTDWQHLVNEPDTDFALPANVAWARQLLARWEPRCGPAGVEVPLVVAGSELYDDRPLRDCLDPSRPGVTVGRYRQATEADIDRALTCAQADEDGWRRLAPAACSKILGRAAQEIRRARGDLMGAALANCGKVLLESDPEVSEAVDFVEFYRRAAQWWQERPGLEARPGGVVVVVSPWNFPIAIPCGGVAAALAAGNTVILKPASDAVLPAWELCQCFWRAGVSRKVLQLVPCSGGAQGRRLVSHPAVHSVVLTGGTDTALRMLADQPDMRLYAETGGKNATIVTAMSDRDQAIKHVIHSAFSHAGQKCSATSLLLLEAEVYDDPRFKRALCDAVRSIPVGSAWDLRSRMGPLIRPPSGDLENALKVLEPGESWAVLPRCLDNNPHLWSPGVKYDVRPGSYTHMTEFFGPLLGVMRFTSLPEAIEMVNQTGFGLTSGIESLDDREQEIWKSGIRAGNLYVNRTTVGAIVLRQPFGGMGKSVFGPGMKAGGPNYVVQFMELADAPGAETHPLAPGSPAALAAAQLERQAGAAGVEAGEVQRMLRALGSYAHHWQEEFSRSHDHFRLLGQDNFRRYLPLEEVCIRVHPRDTAFEILARVCAARVAGCHAILSVPPGLTIAVADWPGRWPGPLGAGIEVRYETDQQVAEQIRLGALERLRHAAPDRVDRVVRQAAAATGACIVDRPVVAEGRVELLWYLREQSISDEYHRYGNLGSRADEPRAPVL